MRQFLRLTFPLPLTAPPWRAVVLYLASLSALLSRLPLLLPGAYDRAVDQVGWDRAMLFVAQVVFTAGCLLAYLLTRRSRLKHAAAILVLMLLMESLLYLMGDPWDSPRGWVGLWIAVALGGLLLEERLRTALVVATVIAVTAGAWHGARGLETDAQNERLAAYITLTLWTLVLAGMTAALGRFGAGAGGVGQKEGASRLILLGEEVAQGLFARRELDTLLVQAAQSIEEQFAAVYHAQIYLTTPDRHKAVLHAGTGAAGQQLLAQEHSVDVGGLNPVGRVTRTGHYLLIGDFRQEPIYKPHPLLPETRSELAIPLNISGDVVGVLDLQSRQPDAFDPDKVAILCAVANQVAIAVDSLQLYETSQRSLRENQALYQQAQANLREIERLNYQLTGRAWKEYFRLMPEATALTLDLSSGQLTQAADWTPALDEAAKQQRVITQNGPDRRMVALPILVRSGAIGAMEFELEPGDDLPPGALDMLNAVGQRLGLALENRRLLDETQRAAQHESLINDISSDLQAATGVDAILQRTARHLKEALAAQQVTIRLSAADGKTPALQGESGHD